MVSGYRHPGWLFNDKAVGGEKFPRGPRNQLTPAAGLPIRPSSETSRTFRPQLSRARTSPLSTETVMKVRSSLKSLKSRHRDCKMVRRKGVIYIINKTDPRFKAKQG